MPTMSLLACRGARGVGARNWSAGHTGPNQANDTQGVVVHLLDST